MGLILLLFSYSELENMILCDSNHLSSALRWTSYLINVYYTAGSPDLYRTEYRPKRLGLLSTLRAISSQDLTTWSSHPWLNSIIITAYNAQPFVVQLEEKLLNCNSVEEIFESEEIGGNKLEDDNEMQYELRDMRCHGLKSVFSLCIAICLHELRGLSICDCEMIEEIVSITEENENTSRLSFASHGKAEDLPQDLDFKSVERFSGIYDEDKKRITQANVMNKIVFHALEELDLKSLSSCVTLHKLETLRDDKGMFNYCTKLQISHCDSIRSLVSPSVAARLVQLEHLEVGSCKKLAEIVRKDSEGGNNNNKILLPKLTTLVLSDLATLSCFCSGAYHLDLPSLVKFIYENCPQFTTFCSTIVSTPKLHHVNIVPLSISTQGDLNLAMHCAHNVDIYKEELQKLETLRYIDEEQDEGLVGYITRVTRLMQYEMF
ncbi:putative P-loop containing nucleoside triphosphate hydrolase, leucine-rich repeat domain, L [Senna tora]|uniref:Putative P-loop containing nucleoside triphosphate hydrolase, leucine-rich repeat domain, L n=1 Tax=Senna tora TaxID=362788 RepID=A0A834SI41_9FABA|nr:putative P-loop containing nucleoside triphosphate hydrolase, leucine-rich repeat domain, L [Senna tora]